MIDIERALTPQQWEERKYATSGENPQIARVSPVLRLLYFHDARTVDRGRITTFATPREHVAVMALANDVLPREHEQKITMNTVLAVLAARVAYPLGSDSHRELVQIAAALGSLLPPAERPNYEIARAYAQYGIRESS
jgi:hypothetical protein